LINILNQEGEVKLYCVMKRILIGVSLGTAAGILDVIPMIIQKLPVQADISAFSMWMVIGFLISVIDINLNSILKGLLVSYIVLLPNLFIIGWDNPYSLIPILILTTILGSLLGFLIGKLCLKK